MRIEKQPARLLLQGGTVLDPVTGNQSRMDILLRRGTISRLAPSIQDEKAVAVDCSGKIITLGFCDLHAHFREPGREDKETLETGSRAALAGGYTRVCIMPNTNPPLDSPEAIRFIVEKAESLPVHIHPIGALTKGQKGREITEMGGMSEEGAVAFSDDGIPVSDGEVMRRALEYALLTGKPVINHAEDPSLRNDGVMHEGEISTRLGLPGNPAEAEGVMVFRDAMLRALTGGRLHVPHVSTAEAVEIVRQFRDTVQLTAEVTPHHLYFTDESLKTYDTHFKVAPPLRSEKHRQALIRALETGVIDCIATDHAPHTREEKEATFANAPFGMIGLESAFGAVHKILSRESSLTLADILRLFSTRPREIFGFPVPPIQTGVEAELVVLDPDQEWTFTEQDIASRSVNSPFLGEKLRGKVHLTLAKGFWARMGQG